MNTKSFRSSHFDLAVDTISDSDVNALVDWLRQYPRLTMADETKRFEEAWSEWLGAKYSVFCNSGSSANLLMYAALESTGLAGNRKVVVPATGWVTTIAPAIQQGWQPFMCESDSSTYGLDVDCLRGILEQEKPDVVVMVHVLGVPNDMEPILELQREYGFELVEDCCASHGAKWQGKLVGTFGKMSSFSFYYGHHMSTIEGGVVSTDDEDVYRHLLMLRSHGWLKDVDEAYSDEVMRKYSVDPFHSPFTFLIPGYNLRGTDLSAYIGMLQLPKLEGTIERRINNHLVYQRMLDGELGFARAREGDTISSISFCAVAESTEERRKVVTALAKEDIDTRIFTAGNLGKHPFWADRYGAFSAPVADKLYNGGFFLPNNQALDTPDVEKVCEVVKAALRG